MLSKSFVLSFVGLLLVTFTVCAGTSVLEGVVKDPNGRPVKGADVRIEAKNSSKSVKTDGNGHYAAVFLKPGRYRVRLPGSAVEVEVVAGRVTRVATK